MVINGQEGPSTNIKSLSSCCNWPKACFIPPLEWGKLEKSMEKMEKMFFTEIILNMKYVIQRAEKNETF